MLIDLPVEADGADRYDAAAATCSHGWQADGVARHRRPARRSTSTAWPYRRRGPAGATPPGVIGALELSRPGEGDILPHEHTTPKAKSDRLDLLRAHRPTSRRSGGCRWPPGLTDLLPTDAEPLAGGPTTTACAHTVWRVDDPTGSRPSPPRWPRQPVVIADGHHRYETSLAYRDERRAADGPGGRPTLTMTLVVELVDDELTVPADPPPAVAACPPASTWSAALGAVASRPARPVAGVGGRRGRSAR